MDNVPPPEMSAATKSILNKVQRLVPPMLESFHKGELSLPLRQDHRPGD
jgi:hypothetical protein